MRYLISTSDLIHVVKYTREVFYIINQFKLGQNRVLPQAFPRSEYAMAVFTFQGSLAIRCKLDH
jgi:hypothetical protein